MLTTLFLIQLKSLQRHRSSTPPPRYWLPEGTACEMCKPCRYMSTLLFVQVRKTFSYGDSCSLLQLI